MSKTEKNLMDAFAGESQANRKYLAFAKQADKEGLPQVAKLFRAAAEAETIHAHAHLRNAGKIGYTTANLKAAIEGETYEFTKMYPEMIADAKEEGRIASPSISIWSTRLKKCTPTSTRRPLPILPPSPATSMSVPCAATRRKAPATSAPSVAPWLPLSPRSTSFLRVR